MGKLFNHINTPVYVCGGTEYINARLSKQHRAKEFAECGRTAGWLPRGEAAYGLV